MSKELWKYFDELRCQGWRFNLETVANAISEKKGALKKDDIINILIKNRFFGDYYTPNNIAKFMAELGRLNKPKRVIDICCGVGNILSYCDYAEIVEGVDINSGAVSLARIINPNMKIEVGDSLKKSFKQKYDLVLGDFPFGMRIRSNNKTLLGENLFIKKGLSILNKNGVLICTVPNGFLFSKGFLDTRKSILKDFNLKLITYMPRGILPNSSVRFAILHIENSKLKDKVYLADYKDNPAEILANLLNETGELYVTKNEIEERWDSDYHDPEFSEIEKKLRERDVKSIEEMADVFIGYSPNQYERLDKGEYLIVGGRNIKKGIFKKTNQDKYINHTDTKSFERAILYPGDIIVNLLFKERKIYIYKEADPKAVLNSSCALIRSPHNEYILTYLRTKEGQRLFLKQADKATGAGIIPRLTLKDLMAIKIPILPIDNLIKLSFEELDKSSADELETLIASLDEELQEKFSSAVERFAKEIKSEIQDRISSKEILERIQYGESTKLEFKSTLRFNIHSKKIDREIENSVLKTIVAFCNSGGGELFIGINDEGEILGIELDNFKNKDKYLLHLGNLIEQRIISLIDEFIDYRIIEIDEKKICQVNCRRCTTPVWLKPDKDKDEQFFVRTGPASKPLSPIRAIEYIKEHFK